MKSIGITVCLDNKGIILLEIELYKEKKDGKRIKAQMSTGIHIDSSEWNGVRNAWVKGDSDRAARYNAMIGDMIDFTEASYMGLITAEGPPDLKTLRTYVKKNFREKPRREPMKLLQHILPEYIAVSDLSEARIHSYNTNLKASLIKFMKTKMSCEDILVRDINTQFLFGFEMYLRKSLTRLGRTYTVSSVRELINMLSAILAFSVKRGDLKEEAIKAYAFNTNSRTKKDVIENVHDAVKWKISPDDLAKIEIMPAPTWNDRDGRKNQFTYDLARPRLLFLFQTWSGMAYADMLKYRNIRFYISKNLSGHESIIYHRQKTGQLAAPIIFPETRDLLEQLSWDITPEADYDTYYRRIKALMRFYCIEIHEDKQNSITHLGRHLFGSRCLKMGFSLETISVMMGHASISETEKVYARPDIISIAADYSRITAQNQKMIAV